MQKKNLAIILVVALLLALFYFKIPLDITGGFTTLSLSEPNFYGNDPNGFLVGKVFALTVRQGGLAQYAIGTISADQIQDDGYKVKKGFKLELNNTMQRCRYPLTPDYASGKVYKYDLATANFGESCASLSTRCSSFGEVVAGCFKPTATFNYYCLYRNPITSYSARLKDSADYGFNTDFILTVDGASPIVGKMGNFSDTLVKLGNTAVVVWQGNLQTGEECDTPSSGRILALYKENVGWGLVNETQWEDYIAKKNSLQNLLSNPATTDGELQTAITQTNIYANIINTSNPSWNNAQAADKISFASGYFFYDLAKQLQFPVFTAYVKADELGIYQPVPHGKIVSLSGGTFKTGEQGLINITFQNDGEVQGGFFISATCTNGMSQAGTTLNPTVPAGSTQTVSLPITGSCSSTTIGTCAVKVAWLGGQDTGNVSMTCSPQQICDPNRKVCIEDVIKQCNSEGTRYPPELWIDCKSQGKVCGTDALGNLVCQSGPSPPRCGNGVCDLGEQLLCPQDCQSPCGNKICDFGEQITCPSDCIPPEKTECLARVGDGIFILDWNWIEPTLFSAGECRAEYNWVLILGSLVVVGGIIGVVYLWKKKR